MKNKNTKSMQDILHSGASSLQQIVQKTQQLQELNRKILNHLEEDVKAHCRVANLDNGVLTLSTDSAAWSTRIRYIVPELLNTLRNKEKMYGLCSIKCVVKKG